MVLCQSRDSRERRRKVSQQIRTLIPVRVAQSSSAFFHYNPMYISSNKWKRKVAYYIFIHQCCAFPCIRLCVGSRVRPKTPEKGRRTYRPKCCDYNNEDEDTIPNILSDVIMKLHLRNFDQWSNCLNVWTAIALLCLDNVDCIQCRGVSSPTKKSVSLVWYGTACDGEDRDMEIWRIWITTSLPLLPGQFWNGMVVTVRVPSLVK